MSAVCYMGGEIKDPHKNMPRALIISVIIVSLLYVLLSFVATGLLPIDVLAIVAHQLQMLLPRFH